MKSDYYQQGDVLLKPTTTMDKKLSKLKPLKTKVVEEGEATGHAHRVVGDADLFRSGNIMYVKSKNDFELKHEEHNTIKIPAGTYRVEGVREFDNFKRETRRVVD